MESIFLLILGLGLILAGANYLTDGAAAIARRANISGFVVGLTVVAVGTSMPEMVVSVVSALKGSSEIAIGNVVGSNTFNTLVILGFCAAIRPIALTQLNVSRDIPMSIIASLLLVVMAWSGAITRLEGVILLLIYCAVMILTIRNARPSHEEKAAENEQKIMKWRVAIPLTLGGLAALIFGGEIFINSATAIAQHYNIPQNIIAITLVAGGTSLPEFAASLVSLIKGKSDIALGNVIGSNIANILLVLGASSTLTTLTMGGVTMVDVAVVALSSAILFLTAFTLGQNRIDRAEGVVMVLLFFGYIGFVVFRGFF